MRLTIAPGTALSPLVTRQLAQLRTAFLADPLLPIEWKYEGGVFEHPWRIIPTEILVEMTDDTDFEHDNGLLMVSIYGWLNHKPGVDPWGESTHINLLDHAIKGVDRE